MDKFTLSMLALLVLGATMLFGGFAQYVSTAIPLIIAALAILAWFNNVSKKRSEKSPLEKKAPKEEETDEEYHNDFSKVPAGTPDGVQPPPRSIGYGYGDGGRSVMEDLERIGIKKDDDQK